MATDSSTLIGKSVRELRALLTSGSVSAREILQDHIQHIERFDPELGAFNCLTTHLAYEQAEKIDALVKKREPLPALAGVPVAIKDNICVPGYPATCSSKILQNFVPPYSATVIERLGASGAIIIGKTNMDEFAMGSSTENSAFAPTHKPWMNRFSKRCA